MTNINHSEYPIFSGRVVSVPVIIEDGEMCSTVISYVTPKDEPSEEEMKKLFPLGPLSMMLPEHLEKANEKLENRVKTATVPLRIDPSIVLGAEIRTRLGEINPAEHNGEVLKTYELEIIRGKRRYSGDIFSDIAQRNYSEHTGLRYIKVLRESE